MKKLLSILLTFAIVLTVFPTTALAADYSDTEGHWAEEAIHRWTESGVVEGDGTGRFYPKNEMTRAEAAEVFARLMHLTEKADISKYTDVPSNAWYAEAIAKCVAAGIMEGDNTKMSPKHKLTREQLFTMAARALGVKKAASADKVFRDSDQISAYAVGFVNALINMGVLEGMGNGILLPRGNINRASVMTVLDKMIGTYADHDGVYAIDPDRITLVVAENVTLTGEANGLPVVVATAGATIDLQNVTGEPEILVKANDVTIKNAPVGTTVTTARHMDGTTVNGKPVAADSVFVVQPTGGYAPSNPPAQDDDEGDTPSNPPAQDDDDDNEKSVVEKFADGDPMSVAHRAAWRAGPENSLLAIDAAINMGIDVVELDAALTKDGIVVLSHDSSISRCISGSGTGKISDYTWDQLRNMAVLDGQGGSLASVYTLSQADADLLNSLSGYTAHCGSAVAGGTMPLTRLDDALELIGDRCMVNLDKGFDEANETDPSLFAATYVVFRNANMLDQVLFKHSVGVEYLNACYAAAAEAWNAVSEETITADDVKADTLCVYVTSSSSPDRMRPSLDNGDNLVMAEICIADDVADRNMRKTLEPWCRENNIAMFVNTMWSGLCSTKPDTQTTWAEMLQRGYQMIQTDRPRELAQYLKVISQPRQASDLLEAEHFNTFCFDSIYRLTVAEPADAYDNKYVESIGDGDWMAYENVVFDGSEALITIRAQGLADHSTLTFYLDEMSASHVLTSFSLNESDTYDLYSHTATSAAAGSHTVFVVVSGTPDTDLVSLDYFTFSGAIGSEVEIEPVSVTTAPGIAPKLPASVSVVCGDETYGLEVRWERIPESWYAEKGDFTVLGYIDQLDTYVKATVTVRPVAASVVTDGLQLWLDASQGVTTDGTKVTQWASRVGNWAATLRTGSPALVANAAGNGAGVYFDGSSALDLILGDNFWDGGEAFTVLFFSAPEITTQAGSGATYGQRKTLLYFPQEADWGSAYFSGSQNELVFRIGSGERDDYGAVYVRKNPIGSMYTATAMRKDGLDNAIFVDGQRIWSGRSASETAKYITSAGYIGLGKYDEFFKGTVCEILIYDRALSDEEILSAQQYMAEKYSDTVTGVEEVSVTCQAGNMPVLPGTVRVEYAAGKPVDMGVSWAPIASDACAKPGTFSVSGTLANGQSVTAQVVVSAAIAGEKADIPVENILFWMSAQEGVEADSDGKVTGWTSKGGSYKAIPEYGSAVLTEDGVVFQNSTLQMELPAGSFNGLDGATIVAYVKPQTALTSGNGKSNSYNSQRNTLFYVNETSSGNGSVYLGIYTDTVTCRVGKSNNDYGIHPDADGSMRGPVTSFSTTTVLWDSTSYTINVDGKQFATHTGAEHVSANNQNTVYLGRGKNGATSETTYWNGVVCELMFFNKKLSEAELEAVYDYLAETYITGVPTDGLLFWLDASEGVTDEDGKVTKWASKVGDYVAEAEDGTVTINADASNRHNGLVFNGASSMTMQTETGTFNGLTGATIIAYAQSNTKMAGVSSDQSVRRTQSQRNSLIYIGETGGYNGSVFLGVYTNIVTTRLGTGEANNMGFYEVFRPETKAYTTTVVRWDTANYDVDVNGADYGSIESVGNQTKNNDSLVVIGRGKTPAAGKTYWDGTVCEILFYDRVLSDDELAAVYAYLDEKYVSSDIPVSGIYLKESGQEISLRAGDTCQLTASVVPTNATHPDLVWSSSNTDIATVDGNGVVSANSLGLAVIYVETVDAAYRAYCTVLVEEDPSADIWRDIQTMVDWASRQDPGSYSNWQQMAEALQSADSVSKNSSLEELRQVYDRLRQAFLTL